MRQLIQLEGSSWCGAIVSAMVLDHFRRPYQLETIKRRFAEYNGQDMDSYDGATDNQTASFLVEQGLEVLLVQLGYPMQGSDWQGQVFWKRSHDSREARVYSWYTVHSLLARGYIGIVGYERDAGKSHYVTVVDAFLRAGEHWFSVVCPLRGAYEEQAERFLLSPNRQGTGLDWIFVRERQDRFASASSNGRSSEEVPAGE